MSDQLKAPEVAEGGNLWYGIDLNKCTKDEFWSVVGEETGNPKAREEYLTHPDKFADFDKRLEEMLIAEKSGTTTTDAAATPAQPGDTAQPANADAAQSQSGEAPAATDGKGEGGTDGDTEEEVVLSNVKIPKSLFGTYLSNRTPDQAIIEALKGNHEKDRTIETFKERNSNLSSATMKLQKQLLDATIKAKTDAAEKPAATPAQPFPSIEVEEVDFGKLEDADLMDPDIHDVVKNEIRKARKAYDAVRQAITATQEAAKAQPSPDTATPFNPDEDPDVTKLRGELNTSQVQRDVFEIDSAASQVPELKMSKPFQQVDLEVSSFYDRVKQAAGITGDRMTAVAHYFGDSPDSKIFRSNCEQQGIVPPPDFHKHQIAFRAYQNRKKDMAALKEEFRINPPEAFSMQRYLAEELRKTPIPSTASGGQNPAPTVPPATTTDQSQSQGYQEKIEQHVQKQTAFATPEGVIPDIPPSSGSQVVAPLGEAEQNAIALKVNLDPGSLTVEEAKWWCDACRAIGLDDNEINPTIRKKAKG